jgi:hypothetical protein
LPHPDMVQQYLEAKRLQRSDLHCGESRRPEQLLQPGRYSRTIPTPRRDPAATVAPPLVNYRPRRTKRPRAAKRSVGSPAVIGAFAALLFGIALFGVFTKQSIPWRNLDGQRASFPSGAPVTAAQVQPTPDNIPQQNPRMDYLRWIMHLNPQQRNYTRERTQRIEQALAEMRRAQDPWRNSPSPRQSRDMPYSITAGSSCMQCGSRLAPDWSCPMCDRSGRFFSTIGSPSGGVQSNRGVVPNQLSSSNAGWGVSPPTGFSGTSTPNLDGGSNFRSSTGETWKSTPNYNGGFDYRSSSGKTWSSKRNINGGLDYNGP